VARGAAVVTAVEGALEGGGGVAAVGVAVRTGGVPDAAAGGLIHDQQLLLHTRAFEKGRWGLPVMPEWAGADGASGVAGVACARAPGLVRLRWMSETFGFHKGRTLEP
jgi:hypothetical protein